MNNIFTIPATGYAMLSKDSKFTPIEFTRHSVGDNDILIEILYSGICHSDIHTAKDEWGGTSYPCIPGHEIAGQVIAVGKNVTKFKIGDYAGVGCMVNSCGECEACKASQEQFCQLYQQQPQCDRLQCSSKNYKEQYVQSGKFQDW